MLSTPDVLNSRLPAVISLLGGPAADPSHPAHAWAIRLAQLFTEAVVASDLLPPDLLQTIATASDPLSDLADTPGDSVPTMVHDALVAVLPFERDLTRLAARKKSLRFLTAQDAMFANALVLGEGAEVNRPNLDLALRAHRAAFGGGDLGRRAAMLWWLITRHNPFPGGNEATATLLAFAFLALNGKTPTPGTSEMEALLQNLHSAEAPPVEALGRAVTAATGTGEPRSGREIIEALFAKYQTALATVASRTRRQVAGLTEETLPEEQKNLQAPAVPYEIDDHNRRGGLAMSYLTPHDIIWINTEVTGEVNEYQYAPLEDAIYHQYSYRDSRDVLHQAGLFVEALAKRGAFTAGNQSTALVSVLAFLKLNGFETKLAAEDAAAWISGIAGGQTTGEAAVAGIASAAHGHGHGVGLRSLVRGLIETYREPLSKLEPAGQR